MDARLAGAFLRTGWIGFWIQVTFGAISIALLVYAFVIDRNAGVGTRGWPVMIQYLTIASLLVLAFTTVWSYRYILLARQLAGPDRGPTVSGLRRTVGVGVAASTLGLVLSMVIMLFEVFQLFLYFLRAPKAGVPVIQVDGQATWVSAGDILNLAILIIVACIEVVVLSLGLWLLFRVSTASAETPQAKTAAA
jgi:Protein of unknown function (DUF3611)